MGYTLLDTKEPSNDTTVTFTTGIDATYKEYEFRFVEITAGTSGGRLTFQADIGTATTYEQNMTTTNFKAHQSHSSSGTSLGLTSPVAAVSPPASTPILLTISEAS